MRHFLPGRSLYVLESMWGSSQWRHCCLISKEAHARPWLICIPSNVYQQTIFPIIKIRLWDLPCIASVWINLSYCFFSCKHLGWQEYYGPLDMSNMSISRLVNHRLRLETKADGESWSRTKSNHGMHLLQLSCFLFLYACHLEICSCTYTACLSADMPVNYVEVDPPLVR